MTTTDSFEIDGAWIDGEDLIESRVGSEHSDVQDDLRHVLRYLFVSNGPTSVNRNVKARVETLLSPVELFVFQWLFKRTDGKLKRHYGAAVLDAVKQSRYQCERCGFRDVRALNLEKNDAKSASSPSGFVCVCANCNTVAARAKEMAVVAFEKELAAKLAAEAAEAAAMVNESTEPVAEVASSTETTPPAPQSDGE